MRFPKLKGWWINFLMSTKEKCTLGNLIDLSVMSVFALANAIMSASHPYVTIFTTSSAIGLSYAVDVMSNRTKINKLGRLKDLLDDETEEIGNLEQKYPDMSKGSWLFFGVSVSCLGFYFILSIPSLVSGSLVPVFGVITVVGASTIFHIAKKFYNSPLAKNIHVAENRLSEVVRKRLPLVVEREAQDKIMAALRAESDELKKQIQDLQKDLEGMQTQHRILEAEKAQLQKQLGEGVEVIHKMGESFDGLKKLNTDLMSTVAILEESNGRLYKTETALREQLETTVTDRKKDFLEFTKQCEQLQKALSIERGKNEILEKEIEVLKREHEQMSEKMDKALKM